MNIKLKIISASLACLLSGLALTGCSEDVDNNKESTAALTFGETDYKSVTNVLRISTDGAWTMRLDYVYPAGHKGWISVPDIAPDQTGLYHGNGSTELNLTIAENPLSEERRAVVTVAFGNGGYTELSFKQGAKPDGPTPDPQYPGWLELPQVQTNSDRVFVTHNASGKRNYSILYDRTTYAGVWVAYPLHRSYIGDGRSGSWKYDPIIDRSWQTDLKKSYGVTLPGGDLYARGHQIPNGDRNAISEMQSQTFYYTNSTPQIQNRFNGSIWNTLEGLVRNNVGSDTLYVVTGAVFRTVGGNETIKEIRNQNDNKMIPVPNYYYKVLLKPTGASYRTIGFWLEHKSYSNGTLTSQYACTVRDIERKTGVNFFANLPQEVQDRIENECNASDWGL